MVFQKTALATGKGLLRATIITSAAAVLALAIVPKAGAQAANSQTPQVYVCKYITKPGQGEILKGGKNPILTDGNSVDPGEDGIINKGDEFSDAHGRSVVVALYEEGKPAPTRADCEGGNEEEIIDVPVMPDTTDPCGPANIEWVIPADTESVQWVENEDGSLTAVAGEGYVFSDETYEHDYALPADSNVACPVTPPEGGRGGVVESAATTTPVVAPAAAQLENTGTSVVLTTTLGILLMGLALTAFAQNTAFSGLVARSIKQFFAQPFVVPTA